LRRLRLTGPEIAEVLDRADSGAWGSSRSSGRAQATARRDRKRGLRRHRSPHPLALQITIDELL
jgi:hypothetical protein